MDISFIIPAYNAESVIEKSISSIQKWNYDGEIEIIVINDGSDDHTQAVCEKMSEADGRICVYSIPNSGQGIARNKGLSLAQGKYVFFADADDAVKIENVYAMWLKAKEQKVNVVMGSYERKTDTDTDVPNLPTTEDFFSLSNDKKSLYHLIKTESVFGYLWNKLYEKEFLLRHDLLLDDIRKVYMEDLLFNVKVWCHRPTVYYMGIPVYEYNVGNESTTRKADERIHEKNVAMIEAMVNYLEQENALADNLDMVIPIVMRMYCWSLVKNIPYEGNSVKKIRKRSIVFCKSAAVNKCIRQKKAMGQLFYLPSKLQSIFYGFCGVCLKWKWNTFLAIVFFLTYPILKKYIAHTLK